MAKSKLSIEARFLSKIGVRREGECWLWLAGRTSDGYGRFYLHPRTVRAHRLAYELWVGRIPAGLVLDHLCRNRACVNPAHLEPVTVRENALRSPIQPAATNLRKLTCKRGHPLSGDNLADWSTPGRVCRTCQREAYPEREKRARERRRQKVSCPDCSKVMSRGTVYKHRRDNCATLKLKDVS